MKAGIELLNRDEKMSTLISKYGISDLKPGNDYFLSLLRSIVFQQVSGKAANTIFKRFIKLIPKNSKITSKEVLKLDKNDIRNNGIPLQRTNYIINLAECLNMFFAFCNFHLIRPPKTVGIHWCCTPFCSVFTMAITHCNGFSRS